MRRSFLVSIVALLGNAAPAKAQAIGPEFGPHPLSHVRVVWASHERIWLVSGNRDPLPFEIGTRIELLQGGFAFATAEVSRVLDPECVVARRVFGASPVTMDPPGRIFVRLAPMPRLARLDVGYPGGRRGDPRASCGKWTPQPIAGYVAIREPGPRTSALWVRDSSASFALESWPDTLELLAFADAADQEIALERGEIDVAVFHPDELSERMRRDPLWRGFPVVAEPRDSRADATAPPDSSRVPAAVGERGALVLGVPGVRAHVRVLGATALAGLVRCPRASPPGAR